MSKLGKKKTMPSNLSVLLEKTLASFEIHSVYFVYNTYTTMQPAPQNFYAFLKATPSLYWKISLCFCPSSFLVSGH